jgi:hypothetical protein
LNRMKLVINRLTDQRKRYTTNHYGQLKSDMMVNDFFDPELRIFFSDDLPSQRFWIIILRVWGE